MQKLLRMLNNYSYRIKANINEDKVIKTKIDQNYDILEILSLKLTQSNVYKLHTSKYGLIVGRVMGNGGFGIPNAKISVFVQVSDEDINDPILSSLYPYNTTASKNESDIRYNLLPDYKVNDCYQVIGTFPNKRLVLDNDNVLEIYDTYYKYTTRTNESGDYMIFGVPTGNQTVHVDLDLSDIGILSQKPRDFVYKGYNITQFENPNQFKKDTNIDSLTQVYSQDSMVYVYPFWGDEDEGTIAISRNDIQIQYKFEPTCIFIGCIVSDSNSNGISKKCIANNSMGAMDELVTGNGTIEMIRKKQDGSVEELQIQGTQLINGDGIWCYQIPMNLDYMTTDEYGNMVPTDDPDKGIPTRARVRFRISMQDFESDNTNNHRAKVLVPNNPKTKDDLDYNFGSATYDDKYATKSFRDLFWNNVYTVKSYIPRIQKGNNNRNERFTGIKHCNIYNNNNPIPYNNIRLKLPFMFVVICAIIKAYIWILKVVNKVQCDMPSGRLIPRACRYSRQKNLYLGDGLCPDLEGWYYAPGGCGTPMQNSLNAILSDSAVDDKKSIDYTNDEPSPVCMTRNLDYLINCVEINLAQEYEVINFDFYNDWINGMVYIPRWIRNIRKKRSYLFGLIKIKPKVQACMESSFKNTRKFTQQCAISYKKNTETGYYNEISDSQKVGCTSNEKKQKCHKGNGRSYTLIFGGNGGIVHEEKTLKGQSVYYFKPCEWKNINGNNVRCILYSTDIVLLGSLNDCDLHGIPQAFKELQTSTYQMPTNLALTNMDSEGYMFGMSKNGVGGTVCNNKLSYDNGAVIVNDNFESYRSWTKDTPYSEQVDSHPEDDVTAITEAAGIDWGYSGPGQGDRNLDYLYFPGGHFLGISCTNAEVNIKSCVNLSRMCEQGVWMSQRQEIPRQYNMNNQTFEYLAITPNGLISKDEISDTDFRSMFATMNINNLETEYDTSTGYNKYKFTYLRPLNFNGELEKYVKKSQGKNTYYYATNVKPTDGEKDEMGDYAIRRAIESVSNDYYRFRFGLKNNESPITHYLIQNGNDVSLPMYENSFYFYFGLHDGSTALDEFKKQFFSSCPNDDEYIGDFDIQVKNSSICNEKGSVTVKINDLSFPCRFSMYINSIGNDVLDYQGCKTYLDGYYMQNSSDSSYVIEIDGISLDKWYLIDNINNGNSYTEIYDNGVEIIYNKYNNTNWFVGNKKIKTTLAYANGDKEIVTFTPCYLTYTSDNVDTAYRLYDWNKIIDENYNNVTPSYNELNTLTSKIGYNIYYTSDYGDSYSYVNKSFDLHNIPMGTHTITVIDSNAKTINKEFLISRSFFEYNITSVNFTKDPSDESAQIVLAHSKNNDEGYGYLAFNGFIYDNEDSFNVFSDNTYNAVLYIICNNSYITTNKVSNAYNSKLSEVIGFNINGYNYLGYNVKCKNNNGIAIWKADYFDVYVVYTCPDSNTIFASKLNTYLVTSPSKLKLYISNMDYDTKVYPYISSLGNNWWEKLDNSLTGWKFKKILFYESPVEDGAFSFGTIYYTGGISPVQMNVWGQGEMSDEEDGTLSLDKREMVTSDNVSEGYSLSLSSVGIPSWNYKVNGEQRLNFGIEISDSEGTKVPENKYFEFPAMYRPFYANCVVWKLLPSGDESNEVKVIGKIHNGITFNKQFGPDSRVIADGSVYNLNITVSDTDMYINSNESDYNKNGRVVNISNDNLEFLSKNDEYNDVYSIIIDEGKPSDEELEEDEIINGETGFEFNSIRKTNNAEFVDNFEITTSNDNEISIGYEGNLSTDVSYYLINGESGPYPYPYDENGNLIDESYIFRDDLNEDNIVNESNNNVYKISFDNTNKSVVNCNFNTFYIIGMSNTSDELNSFTACKLYQIAENGTYSFTVTLTLDTTNKTLSTIINFVDTTSFDRFSKKNNVSCDITCDNITISYPKTNIKSNISNNNFTFPLKTLSDEDFELFNQNTRANSVLITLYGFPYIFGGKEFEKGPITINKI